MRSFNCATHKCREEWRRGDIEAVVRRGNALALLLNLRLDICVELPVCRVVTERTYGTAHNFGKRESIDIRNLHTILRNDKLPTSRYDIVVSILLRVAELHKSRNYHIVVVVLWESQAALGKFRSKFVDIQRSICIASKVNLRVDEIQRVARLQTHTRHIVEEAVTLGISTAEYKALAIVALLHTDVEVAILVACEEELGDKFVGLLIGNATTLDVALVIWVDILIEATECIVVAVTLPECEVNDAEQLQRLVERLCTLRVDRSEHFGNSCQTGTLGTSLILEDKCLYSLKRCLRSYEELLLLLGKSGILQARLDIGLALAQSISNNTLVIGREVRYGTTLMQGVLRANLSPLLLGEDGRDASYGASGNDSFTLDNNRSLGIEQCR